MIRSIKTSRAARWVVVLGACLTFTAGDAIADSAQGWLVTGYYTPVESFHPDALESVFGCRQLEGCDHGKDELGRFPRSFIAVAAAEGTGRITSGPQAGRYLNWSYDIGYWLDASSRDSNGCGLIPFHTAAADGLTDGTRVRLADCGKLAEGNEPEAAVCPAFKTAAWRIRDEFTPGLGGERHLDLYVCEEPGEGFTDGPWYTTLVDMRLEIRR